MTTIYVAGPMTGLPDLNYPSFYKVSARLDEHGFDVLNPARHGVIEDATWLDYMRLALKDLARADGLCVLYGWETSAGASLEVEVARRLHLPVRSLLEWLNLGTRP